MSSGSTATGSSSARCAIVERQHGNRFEQRQAQNFERQRGNRFDQVRNNETFRNDLRGNRVELAHNRDMLRDELRANRIERLDNGVFVRDVRNGPRLLRAEDFGDRARAGASAVARRA